MKTLSTNLISNPEEIAKADAPGPFIRLTIADPMNDMAMSFDIDKAAATKIAKRFKDLINYDDDPESFDQIVLDAAMPFDCVTTAAISQKTQLNPCFVRSTLRTHGWKERTTNVWEAPQSVGETN